MDLFDVTLPTPAENLALDEALLDEAEDSAAPREALRLWEAAEPLVVVGRNSQLAAEVRVEACRRRNIPILRRASGGCAILAGPGCLMYSLVLSYELRPELHLLEAAHRFVLGTIAGALRPLVGDVAHLGTSDLAAGGNRKFSGNSLRCRRRAFLYHGTLLYDFPLALIDECLAMPPRQPDYRQGRPHGSFLANLPLAAVDLRRALIAAWGAAPSNRDWPRARVRQLVAARYGVPDWNLNR
jgi:lipoate-protein ligase A